MKRIMSVILVLAMVLSLAACGTPAENTTAAPETTKAIETTKAPETEPVETEPAAVYTAGTYTGTAVGHNGNITVEVTVSENKIEKIDVVESVESNGIGNVAADHVIADVLERQSLNVDAVAGCTISRAGFVGAITSALEAAGADVAALAEIPVEKVIGEDFTINTDVVVIGSGAAGMSAAIEAAQAGAKVVVLEKLPRDGGATRTSSAMLVVGGSKLQAAANIEDSVQNLKDYWIQRGEGNIDEEQTNYVADHANEALDWLIDMGVNYAGGMILFSGTATITRAHMPALSGVEMMDRMVETAKKAGVEIYLETAAVSLIQDANGAVVGVKADQNGAKVTVNAKSVVIATGGYGWNADLRAKYSPDCSDVWPVTSPGNTGDGLLMAMEIGADTVFKGGFIGWKVVSPAYGHTTAVGGPIYGAANLIVNKNGDRFANESLDYPFLYADMQKDGSDKFYFIFDSGASETKDLVENVSNTVANLELAVAAGVCFKADTLEELAQVSGLTNLADTTAKYNAAITAGKDEEFGRDTSTMIAIENGPYYALQCQKAILGTFGGLNTNITGEVVDATGNAIPGLYAAGEVANGEFFPVLYPASGSSLSMCVVFGREAGISAAAYAAGK